jgi:hypothetical protein
MEDSFRKGRPGLQSAAQDRDLVRGQGPGRKLFEGAEGDAVGLAQGAVDGAGFGHAHFGMVEDQGGNIAGMGIAVADEAPALG